MQSESSSRHRGGPMPNRWCINYTRCRFNTEWPQGVCVDMQDSEHVCTTVPQTNASTASTHGDYARWLRHCSSNRSLAPTTRNVFFSMRRAVCLNSLPASVIGNDSLSVFKSMLKNFYFVSPISGTHNRLPPAPLKLRPYDALQICLLLLYYYIKNWFIKRYQVVTLEASCLPKDGRNHLRCSLHLPTERWPGWVGLSGLNKYQDGRPAEGRHQSQY